MERIPMKITNAVHDRSQQMLVWDFETRLERRYAQHVRQIATSVGIRPGRKAKTELIREVAERLATGNYPAAVIKHNLYG